MRVGVRVRVRVRVRARVGVRVRVRVRVRVKARVSAASIRFLTTCERGIWGKWGSNFRFHVRAVV